MPSLSVEEQSEAERHDRLYSDTRPRNLVMEPSDWEKFDRIEVPLNSYHASIKRLGDVTGLRVLDAGCGDGWLSIILAKRGAIVDGFDISDVAIGTARDRAEANDVVSTTRFDVASMYELPYEDATFDLIIGQAILHHVEDKAQVAAELRRVLKPGGRAVFSEPLGSSVWLERVRRLVPVPSAAADNPDEEQFTHAQVELLERLFDVDVEEFQLFSRLDRVLSSPRVLDALGKLDRMLLRRVRWLRTYARTAVIELRPRPVELVRN